MIYAPMDFQERRSSRPGITALDAPLDLGNLADSDSDVSLDLELEFRAANTSNYTDLLQTDDANDGLQFEIVGTVIGLISTPSTRPSRPEGSVISEKLEIGRWYGLKLSALSRGRVRVQLADRNPIVVNNRFFAAKDVRIGIGFNSERRFTGDIRNLRIVYGPARSTSSANAILALLALVGACYYAACITLYRRVVTSIFAKAYSEIVDRLKPFRPALHLKWRYHVTRCPDVERRRTIFCTVVAYGFVGAVVWHFMGGMFYGVPAPWNSFLPDPISRFSDFYQINSDWVRFRFDGVAYGLLYFPSTYLLVQMFTYFPSPYSAVAVFLAICCTFFAWYSYVNLRSDSPWASARDMLLGCFLTYPFIFLVHTANYEFFVAMFVGLFLFFYQRNQLRLAGFFLAFAISMKIMPGVFLVLLVADRRYRMLPEILAWIVLLSLVPLMIFRGGILDGPSHYLSNFNQS